MFLSLENKENDNNELNELAVLLDCCIKLIKK